MRIAAEYSRIQRGALNRLAQRAWTRDSQRYFATSPRTLDRDALRVYSNLHPLSDRLSFVVEDAGDQQAVNLVLPELRADAIFAGIGTALRVAAGHARRQGLPLRVIGLRDVLPRDDKRIRALRTAVMAHTGLDSEDRLELVGREALLGLRVSPEDHWLLTHWTTAHAFGVARRLGTVTASTSIYLVQDYEPGFVAWSTDYALARATYHEGHILVVNSTPLADYLARAEKLTLDDDLVFRPQIDERPGRGENRSRTELTVFFYARPSKPRNLYAIGVAVLKAVADRVGDWPVPVRFVSAGESHADVVLGHGVVLSSRGKLTWDDYFSLIDQTDVVLSLQHSPHPSHPPLDAVSRGVFAVTNEFDGVRNGLSPLLVAAEPRIDELADAVVDALRSSFDQRVPTPGDGWLAALGAPLDTVLDALSIRVANHPGSGPRLEESTGA
ncbi:hypothetical protein [Microbacterium paludicola]|uniref:rhamnosyltransferase WsaF family glycosyltransferase n=1 Tax=Microbacterium paludicola TaxID=300019 RepID=UPI000903C02D|nr:hypothetical protein [Microbacterium paludicola]APF35088.1 hypothetical protein BO218_13510 [Microbacterium paludicola]